MDIQPIRKVKRETLIDILYGDERMPPISLLDFIQWFMERLGEIPPELHPHAYVDAFNGERIKIYYPRKETDDEMAARIGNEQSEATARRAGDIEYLRILGKRYPGVVRELANGR